MKNIRLWIIAAAITLALLCVGAASAETIASGNCGAEGDNVTWTLDSGGGSDHHRNGRDGRLRLHSSEFWRWRCNQHPLEKLLK